MAPVSCLACSSEPCNREAECRTLPMWNGFYELMKNYFDGISIADLMKTTDGNEYII
jgi:DNA-binding IscR family transcriptional regulator